MLLPLHTESHNNNIYHQRILQRIQVQQMKLQIIWVCLQDAPQRLLSLSSKKMHCPTTSVSLTEDTSPMLLPSALLPNVHMQLPRALKTKSADLLISMKQQRKSRISIPFPSAVRLTARFLRMNSFSVRFQIHIPLERLFISTEKKSASMTENSKFFLQKVPAQ